MDDIDTQKFEEFYDFLDKWVADQPQSSRTSGCPSKEKPGREKAKRNKSKKSGAIRKASMVS